MSCCETPPHSNKLTRVLWQVCELVLRYVKRLPQAAAVRYVSRDTRVLLMSTKIKFDVCASLQPCVFVMSLPHNCLLCAQARHMETIVEKLLVTGMLEQDP